MVPFNPDEGLMRDFSEACEELERLVFPDCVQGTCGYCGGTRWKWDMTYDLRTGKLSCGCHKEPRGE